MAFDGAVLAVAVSRGSGLRIVVVSGFLPRRAAGELSHFGVIGIGNIHDTEWILNLRGFAL
jgi:hypothetical protein